MQSLECTSLTIELTSFASSFATAPAALANCPPIPTKCSFYVMYGRHRSGFFFFRKTKATSFLAYGFYGCIWGSLYIWILSYMNCMMKYHMIGYSVLAWWKVFSKTSRLRSYPSLDKQAVISFNPLQAVEWLSLLPPRNEKLASRVKAFSHPGISWYEWIDPSPVV